MSTQNDDNLKRQINLNNVRKKLEELHLLGENEIPAKDKSLGLAVAIIESTKSYVDIEATPEMTGVKRMEDPCFQWCGNYLLDHAGNPEASNFISLITSLRHAFLGAGKRDKSEQKEIQEIIRAELIALASSKPAIEEDKPTLSEEISSLMTKSESLFFQQKNQKMNINQKNDEVPQKPEEDIDIENKPKGESPRFKGK